eukprot:TRINITY_DN4981_c0_g1_i2.p1 TRINITY_DN4981_c0_g1~~TRINITY_DN4981_c0_g1_i2.p1  ORF type:complete len:175 (+),score=23.29 TRINITY_DN4981_c0_g1_i2:162-686(+)
MNKADNMDTVTLFVFVLGTLLSFADSQCTTEEFSVAYEGDIVFGASRNGSCFCNGNFIGNASLMTGLPLGKSCTVGSFITAINADGSITCGSAGSGSGGPGASGVFDGGLGAYCQRDADCNATLAPLRCHVASARCLLDLGQPCTANVTCYPRPFGFCNGSGLCAGTVAKHLPP